MSTSYYAIMRLKGAPTGNQLFFHAANTTDALNEMCRKAKIKDTGDLDEYELFEVIADRRYRSVAMKPAPAQRSVSFTPPTATPEVKPHPVGPAAPGYAISSI